jgi:hypothetical protein
MSVKYFLVFKPKKLFIMKNAIVVLVLMMAVLVVNGNTSNTSAQQDKPVRTTVMASDLPQAITILPRIMPVILLRKQQA